MTAQGDGEPQVLGTEVATFGRFRPIWPSPGFPPKPLHLCRLLRWIDALPLLQSPEMWDRRLDIYYIFSEESISIRALAPPAALTRRGQPYLKTPETLKQIGVVAC